MNSALALGSVTPMQLQTRLGVWEDGTTGTYTNWATDQPDNGTDADCAMFDTNGQWEDYDCTQDYFYACKYVTVAAATAGKSNENKRWSGNGADYRGRQDHTIGELNARNGRSEVHMDTIERPSAIRITAQAITITAGTLMENLACGATPLTRT